MDGQDAQVHDGLLQAGERGKSSDLPDAGKAQTDPSVSTVKQLRKAQSGVQGDADAGDVLGEDGRFCGAGHAAVKPGDEPQVQHDVEHGRNCEKDKRDDGIAQRAQQGSEEIIEKDGSQAGKDHDEVVMHHLDQALRDLQDLDDPVDAQVDEHVQDQGDAP